MYVAFVTSAYDPETDAVHAYHVEEDSGELDHVASTEAGASPSFLALSPDDERLYAVNEDDDGAVVAFDRSGTDLDRLGSAPSGDDGPCHCAALEEYVLTAHYFGGSVSMLPVTGDGVGDPVDVVEHEGTSVHSRQTEPHPHSITPGPEEEYAYVPDLGTDEVVVYRIDRDAGKLREERSVETHDGAGPRHIDFAPGGEYAYLVNEIDSTLTGYEVGTGDLHEVETVDLLPESFDGDSTAADVHVHPSGEYVYASNRGHDSIAVFEADAGELTPVDHVSTRGETPRNFALSPDGDLLFAENQNTDDVVSFRVEEGVPEPTGAVEDVAAPVCMVFV
jgi:6-phosphogluconolactonase